MWSLVLSEAKAWYTRYLKLDAVSRLTSKPVPSAELTQAKWSRVSRRIETMIIAACPQAVREEISSARVAGLLPVVARLYVIYAPGGLTERELGLKQIQEPSTGTNVRDTVEILRKWQRWCDRMRELGGTLPDSALRIKALERVTRVVLSANPDVAFRVNLTRAALQVDTNPDDVKVEQMHAHLLAELEAIIHRSGAKDHDKNKEVNAQAGAKVRGIEDNPKNPKPGKTSPKTPNHPKSGGTADSPTAGGIPCTFFSGPNGCKKGSDCTFVHNWAAIPPSERAQRCRTCGAKGHRSAECRAGIKGEEKAKYKAPPPAAKTTGNPKNGTPNASATATVPPPPKEMSQQQIKSMLADAAQILQQAAPGNVSNVTQAVPISPSPTPCATGGTDSSPVTQGTPVTLESLNAQIESLRAMTREHEVRMLSITPDTTTRTSDDEVQVKALLDSGATHAVVPFRQEMKDLERVGVTLAGDLREEWFKTSGGTLVVPPDPKGATGERLQTILPLGALVQTLGCKVSWCKKRGLRVTHPRLGPLKVGVSTNTCPYMQEDQALGLIAELEGQKLREFEQSVQAMEAELLQMSTPCDPTEAIRGFISTGDRGRLLRAVFAQPYLKQVPEAIKVKLCNEIPGVSDDDGWKLLKRLPLNRARRRALHGSRQWVVFLCSGAPSEGDPLRAWCQERHLEYLEIDILCRGGKGWDLCAESGVWSVLLWAAAQGRIASVLSSPPHRTWSPTGGAPNGRSLQDPWAAHSSDGVVFRESMLAVQDMVLWSIASVARGYAIPFLKEITSTSSVLCQGRAVKMNPEAFWETDAWKTFQHWAKVKSLTFCQGSLGHDWLCPTVIGTNLGLDHLHGLPKRGSPTPPSNEGCTAPCSQWSKGFKKEVVEALSGKVKGQTLDELDQIISNAKGSLTAKVSSDDDPVSSEPSDTGTEATSEGVVPDPREQQEAEVQALKPSEAEEWRAHIMRGHVPYRRDCRFV